MIAARDTQHFRQLCSLTFFTAKSGDFALSKEWKLRPRLIKDYSQTH